MMKKISNPILSGFNPDPSILRVGEDYYIATSTFEWFPGVQIHHSKDLINWRLMGHAVNRLSQIDLKGDPDSCGIWAPCLTYDEGVFYLVYSDVRTFDGVWKDTHNFLITCSDIEEENWSEPIYLNSSGFDASLFHDNDGRKWLTNMLVDHRKGKFFGGIILQEYSEEKKKLLGPVKHIWDGSDLGVTEGPHLYHLNDYYYLLTAEGGTEYNHAVSLARSKHIEGPYEIHPDNPVISAMTDLQAPLQKTGHGALVQTQSGEWYLTHLLGRPLTERGRCTLGRESGIQKVVWKEDGWLYNDADSCVPLQEVNAPDLPEHQWPTLPEKNDFDKPKLDVNFSTLRLAPSAHWLSLSERPGFLRLYGQESLCSINRQSMVARRIQAFNVEASLSLDFQAENFQQMAGLVFYYNTMHMYYLHVSYDEQSGKRNLQIISADNGTFSEPMGDPLFLPNDGSIYLKGNMNRDALQFYYSLDSLEWKTVGPVLDASILSDDYITAGGLHYRAAFTGSFVGMCCQDLSGQKKYADFDWFKYVEVRE